VLTNTAQYLFHAQRITRRKSFNAEIFDEMQTLTAFVSLLIGSRKPKFLTFLQNLI
jgi:hypothetical protein